ncbi:MAG: phosphoribosylformylglycinamidine cyclo-ligase [Thermodesulfobacteriota bacterium]
MAKTTYKGSGVDIDAGNLFVDLIKPLAASTLNKHVLGKIGGFSGAYELHLKKYKRPVLVAAADGVGTKLKIAFMTGRLDTVGIDLVAMNVNDILACGADPLFFLDYIATSKLNPDEGAEIIKGIVKGCKDAGCALLGGETAEMPGFYRRDEFDLAGFAVGIVDRDEILDGSEVVTGDVVIGLASSGLHSNGYSLARKVLLEKKRYRLGDSPAPLSRALADELLEPTRIYVRTVQKLRKEFRIRAIAHITGGGLLENIPRVIPKKYSAILDSSKWKLPAIMELIENEGRMDKEEMWRTFNCGVGLVLVVPADDAGSILKRLRQLREKAYAIGEIGRRGRGQYGVIIR